MLFTSNPDLYRDEQRTERLDDLTRLNLEAIRIADRLIEIGGWLDASSCLIRNPIGHHHLRELGCQARTIAGALEPIRTYARLEMNRLNGERVR